MLKGIAGEWVMLSLLVITKQNQFNHIFLFIAQIEIRMNTGQDQLNEFDEIELKMSTGILLDSQLVLNEENPFYYKKFPPPKRRNGTIL